MRLEKINACRNLFSRPKKYGRLCGRRWKGSYTYAHLHINREEKHLTGNLYREILLFYRVGAGCRVRDLMEMRYIRSCIIYDAACSMPATKSCDARHLAVPFGWYDINVQ